MLIQLGLWALILNLFGQVESGVNDAIFHRKPGRYLGNYVIKTSKTKSEFDCSNSCLKEPKCVSVNFKVKGKDKGLCELNSQTLEELSEEGQSDVEYIHLEVVMRSCNENEEFLEEIKRCKDVFHSCKDVLTRYKNSANGVYSLKSITSDEYYDVYCRMTDIATCGAGGWTLVMKLDGSKNTFTYDSPLWTNNKTYAIQDGLEGLAEKESKLASYWDTPFTKICLGMSYNGDRKWIAFNYTTSSLYSVIADGQFRATTAGRVTWKSLIAGSSLQQSCRREGFNVHFNNVHSVMRIGIVANNENNCDSCDSWIGLSTAYKNNDGTWSNRMVCGNYAGCCDLANGSKTLNTFGYILVQ